LVLGLLGACVTLAGRSYVQSLMSSFLEGEPLAVSRATQALHDSLFVFDLHCDASFVSRRVLRRTQLRCSLLTPKTAIC
jgi:hypothetical protein